MAKQWEKNGKRRLYLVAALGLILILSGGAFAYTYTTAVGTISVGTPSSDVAISNISSSQPSWSSVTDNLSENTTCGEVPTGDLFDITPNAGYSGDVQVGVYLTNAANLTRAYKYLNMKVYLEGSEEAGETPDYRVLSLQNGRADFSLSGISSSSKSWVQTTKSDFEGGTLYQLDTTTSPGDVLIQKHIDNVTDSFDDQSKIASAVNVTVSGGQVKLQYSAGTPANETLRPTAAGDKTQLTQTPASGANWDKVDEATPDGDTTYVQSTYFDYLEDLYQIANHTAGTGQINYVTVYMVAKAQSGRTDPDGYVQIKTNGVEYNPIPVNIATTYTTYSYQWANNPSTNTTWTWSEIDNLQIGVGLMRSQPSAQYSRVTQVYAVVNYTPLNYRSPGRVTSTNLLSGKTADSIDNFYYDASAIPSGTTLKTQYSTDNATWYNSSGTLNGWDTLSPGSANISLATLGWSGASFYYRAEFTSTGSNTPVLDEIMVYFSVYYTSGTLTSSTYDGGSYGNWDWEVFYFTINEPSSTNIQFQLRSASTEGGLSSATWYGPTGTGDYYTTSGTAINATHDGDRWVQYRADFTSPGIGTPKLSDTTITYTVALSGYAVEIIGGGYCLISGNTSEWAAGWDTTPEFFCEATQR
jgi:hypothetical protein